VKLSTSKKDFKRVKNLNNFYNWLLYDTEEVVGTLMLIGRVGILLVYAVTLSFIIYWTDGFNVFVVLFCGLLAWSSFKLYQFFVMGGREASKGICLDDLLRKNGVDDS